MSTSIKIFESDKLIITEIDNEFYMQSLQSDLKIDTINEILIENKYIKISDFMAIRRVVLNAPYGPVKFGKRAPRITVEISSDKLKAYVILCLNTNELSDIEKIHTEIKEELKKYKVSYGIDLSSINNEVENDKRYLVAVGKEPIAGENSQIEYYKIKEVKAVELDSGNVDYYNLNLINQVKQGEWLGSKKEATLGENGIAIDGSIVKSKKGKNTNLLYDKRSVYTETEDNLTILRAKYDGAISFKNGKITVSNYIEINKNIDFSTGNLEFNGYVTIRGEVKDGFSVVCSKDIEIINSMGIGSVKKIESTEGSIFISGGIAAKGNTLIKAKGDIVTKFVSDATIVCDGTVRIAKYCINSKIKAKEVIIESLEGRIVGGVVESNIRVQASQIGSEKEIFTKIIVSGFSKEKVKEKLEELKDKISKTQLELFDTYSSMETSSRKTEYIEKIDEIKDKLIQLEAERKETMQIMKVKGEGEIRVGNKIHRQVHLFIKDSFKPILEPKSACTFYFKNDEISEE